MTVTIDINGNPTKIKLTSDQVYLLKEQAAYKFKWDYVDYDDTYLVGDTGIGFRYTADNHRYFEHGRYRKTVAGATSSILRNKLSNRLEALAEQLGGLRDFSIKADNYSVYLDVDSNEYRCTISYYNKVIGAVYMTEVCAMKICAMLNNKEFRLDGRD